MDDWHAFEGRVVPLVWGRRAYTILPVPDDVAAAIEATGTRRVEGEIGDFPISLALSRADPDVFPGVFLWTGKGLLDAAGIAPGDVLDVRLRPGDPARVEMPEGLEAALRAAGKLDTWEALTPGRRRGLCHPIAAAKRPATRAKRIAALIAGLR